MYHLNVLLHDQLKKNIRLYTEDSIQKADSKSIGHFEFYTFCFRENGDLQQGFFKGPRKAPLGLVLHFFILPDFVVFFLLVFHSLNVKYLSFAFKFGFNNLLTSSKCLAYVLSICILLFLGLYKFLAHKSGSFCL